MRLAFQGLILTPLLQAFGLPPEQIQQTLSDLCGQRDVSIHPVRWSSAQIQQYGR